jgi:hypothetical protein
VCKVSKACSYSYESPIDPITISNPIYIAMKINSQVPREKGHRHRRQDEGIGPTLGAISLPIYSVT